MNEVQEQKKGVIEINKSRMQLMFTTRARVCVCVCVCVCVFSIQMTCC